MGLRVSLAPQALRELDEIAHYIRTRGSRESAERWFNQIVAEIRTLSESPMRCAIAPESRDAGVDVRLLLHGRRHRQYKIYYVIDETRATVSVVHVRHWARQPLGRDELEELL